jgi:lipase maturation factor 1
MTVSRWMFLRLLGFTYFCAFASLATQIVGLVGANGIVPAGIADSTLRAVCFGGAALSLALVAGLLPIVTVPLLWIGFLWLSTAAGEFLAYQWDALLLETGLLAMLIAPVTLRDRLSDPAPPPRLAIGLMLWLLFRLMFGSGIVKLASGDPTWRDLTAMTFHYETQPIPNPIAFYAHHLPVGINKASTAATLAIELIAPLMIPGPRRLRLVAAALLLGLQLLIAATGNFAYFNLLAIALCVFLVDDDAWKVLRDRLPAAIVVSLSNHEQAVRPSTGSGRAAVTLVVAAITVPVSILYFTSSIGFLPPGWQLVAPVASAIAPLRSVNSYGLFANMTTTRPEIVIEGSNDGETWSAYEFRYKPGDLMRRPPFVAPHQPRLDWQMWFAALGTYGQNPWFANFCRRLLEGSPDVLRLLERDPFNGRPPRYVRGVLYQYHFADLVSHRATGVWWTREQLGAYSPTLSLAASR